MALFKKHVLQGKPPADFFNPPPVENLPGLSPQFSAFRVAPKKTRDGKNATTKLNTVSNKRGAKYRTQPTVSLFFLRNKSPILRLLQSKIEYPYMLFVELPRLIGFRGCRSRRNINAGVLARAQEFGKRRILLKTNPEYENPFGEISDYDPNTGLYAAYLNSYAFDTQSGGDYLNASDPQAPELLSFSEDSVNYSDNSDPDNSDSDNSDSDNSDSDNSDSDNSDLDTERSKTTINSNVLKKSASKHKEQPSNKLYTLLGEENNLKGDATLNAPLIAQDAQITPAPAQGPYGSDLDPEASKDPRFLKFINEMYAHIIPVEPYGVYYNYFSDLETAKLAYVPLIHDSRPQDIGGYLLLSPILLKRGYAPLLKPGNTTGYLFSRPVNADVYIRGRKNQEFTH